MTFKKSKDPFQNSRLPQQALLTTPHQQQVGNNLVFIRSDESSNESKFLISDNASKVRNIDASVGLESFDPINIGRESPGNMSKPLMPIPAKGSNHFLFQPAAQKQGEFIMVPGQPDNALPTKGGKITLPPLRGGGMKPSQLPPLQQYPMKQVTYDN